MLKVLLGLVCLFALLYLGGFIVSFFTLPIPKTLVSIILLLSILIISNKVPIFIRDASSPLLKHMGLFFIPSTVAVYEYRALFAEQWFAMILIIGFSTIISLLVMIWLTSLFMKGVKD